MKIIRKQNVWRRLFTVLFATLAIVFVTERLTDIRIPVLMYHHITTNPFEAGGVTLTEERFRLDMEYLQHYGFTPLLPADLIEIHDGKRELPDNPVMITFDDGYRSNYLYAWPVLQETGMKAAIAVITDSIRSDEDTADETRMFATWGELRQMRESGTIEIGSHTWRLHNQQYGGNLAPDGINGVMRRKGESREDYNQRVGGDLQTSLKMIEQNTGQSPVHYFAYPFGAGDRWIQPLLEDAGIRVSVLTRIDFASLRNGLYNLSRFGVTMDTQLPVLLKQSVRAEPATLTLSVNGQPASLAAYRISGENCYVRAQDVALLLKDTPNGFSVRQDTVQQRVIISPRHSYKPHGNEHIPLPYGNRWAHSVAEPVIVDEMPHMAAAYEIDGELFYDLPWLGEQCGFSVAWDSATQIMKVES